MRDAPAMAWWPIPRSVALVVLLGLIASSVGYAVMDRLERNQRAIAFTAEAAALASQFRLRLSQCLLAVSSVGTYYGASEFVSQREFAAFTSPLLDSTLGLSAVYWAPMVGSEAGTSSWPVTYQTTQETYRLAHGLDLSGDPRFAAALKAANQRRALAVTRHPRGDGEHSLVVALRAPPSLASSAPPGFIVAQLDLGALVAAIDAGNSPLSMALLPPGESVAPPHGDTEAAALLRSHEVPLGDQRWVAVVSAPARYRGKHGAWLPLFVLLSGLVVTLLTAAYLQTMHHRVREKSTSADLLQQANAALTREVEERRAAERALSVSELRYRSLVDTAFGGVMVLDGNTIIETNRRLHDTLGYAENDLVGRPWLDLVAHAERKHLERALLGSGAVVETTLVHRSGGEIEVELSGKHLEEERSGRLLLTLRDISDRKRLDEERARLQRLESLGVMAGGLAHDFNNLLMSVLGNLELAQLDTKEEDTAMAGFLAEAETAALRAKEITQRLITFAKGGAPLRAPMDLAKTVNEAARLASAGSNCEVRIVCAQGLLPANGDRGHLGQVVHNLILNAIQAMPDGGLIEVFLDNEFIAHPTAAVSAGSYVRLRVVDQGPGISQEHLLRVFEPYFSTKVSGHGLGLSASHSIVRSHQGALHVTRTSDQGTEFTMWIPAAHEAPAVEAPTTPTEPRSFHGQVLVMDDDESIRRVLTKMLRRVGLHVVGACNGEEAIALVRSSPKRFSLLILDLTVPGGMGGLAALQPIRDLAPQLPVVVSSGYSNDSVFHDYRSLGFDAVLQKPYTQRDLLKVLDAVLVH